jgi:ATF/CREB family transcription factor
MPSQSGPKSPPGSSNHAAATQKPDDAKADPKTHDSRSEAPTSEAGPSFASATKLGTAPGDYFAVPKASLSLEPNPFEQSFGGSGPDTPGGTKLPSVAALASPSSMIPGAPGTPFNWPGSLRTGPLSPAMLSGPASTNDYFGEPPHFKGGFPTPNESSIRTGLTPGSNIGLFPTASPGTTAMFASLNANAGGATPSTLEFQRTAISVAAKRDAAAAVLPPTSTSHAVEATAAAPPSSMPPPAEPKHTYDHDNDAANGLYLLAQSRTNHSMAPSFAPTSAPTSVPLGHTVANSRSILPHHSQAPPVAAPTGAGTSSLMTSPTTTNIPRDMSVGSAGSDEAQPPSRAPQKKPANGKRKAGDSSSKNGTTKKTKTARSASPPNMDSDDDDMMEMGEGSRGDEGDKGKMTEDEKRKNFLERNRVAALKCRQRKKQWLANLQHKIEMMSTENEGIMAENRRLHAENVNLKTMLMAHKDCPVSRSQDTSAAYMGATGHPGSNGPPGPTGPGGASMDAFNMPYMTNGAGLMSSADGRRYS